MVECVAKQKPIGFRFNREEGSMHWIRRDMASITHMILKLYDFV